MTPDQKKEIEALIDAGKEYTHYNYAAKALGAKEAIKAMYEELIALRAANKGKDEEIERLEAIVFQKGIKQ